MYIYIVSALFSEQGRDASTTVAPLSSLLATSQVFKRYQDRAAKRALDTSSTPPDVNDTIARQLEAIGKKRRRMVKRNSASPGQLIPPLIHPAARQRFSHLPAQGGRISERGTITPFSTFPFAAASSRSNPYVLLPQAQTQAPNDG